MRCIEHDRGIIGKNMGKLEVTWHVFQWLKSVTCLGCLKILTINCDWADKHSLLYKFPTWSWSHLTTVFSACFVQLDAYVPEGFLTLAAKPMVQLKLSHQTIKCAVQSCKTSVFLFSDDIIPVILQRQKPWLLQGQTDTRLNAAYKTYADGAYRT